MGNFVSYLYSFDLDLSWFYCGEMIHLIVRQCKQHSILLSLKVKFHFDNKSNRILHFPFQCSTPLPILWSD